MVTVVKRSETFEKVAQNQSVADEVNVIRDDRWRGFGSSMTIVIAEITMATTTRWRHQGEEKRTNFTGEKDREGLRLEVETSRFSR